MVLKKSIIILLEIIYLLILIFIAYQIIKAIIGGTWQTENILIAGIGIILAGMFAIIRFLINQGKSIGMIEERTKNLRESLASLGRDFKSHIQNG